MGRVTLQTIADQVGVSRMTVSNAFSRPDQLSASLRETILAAAEDLGYVGPDPAARALARGTTGAIGILLTESPHDAFRDDVATGFLGAIAAEFAPSGLALTLLPSLGRGDVEPVRDVAMDGAVVYACNPRSSAIDRLKRRGIPLVLVDQASEPGLSSVNVDDRAGARAAAQHLVDLGHRDVAVIAPGHTIFHVTKQRLKGWVSALDEAGVQHRLIDYTPRDDAQVYALTQEVLKSADRPTAVLCFSDVLARRVIRAANDLGLAVPDDVSVVGFDDNPVAVRMEPSLTTVRQDLTAKGKAVASELTRAIEQARSGRPGRARHVMLPTELVVRDSTAPRPATDPEDQS